MSLLVGCVLCCGCRSTRSRDIPVDAKIVRYNESGTEAFSEGNSAAAIKSFRKAVLRSWATDDPYQSGTNAYNLAAAWFDRGDNQAAKDWLIEARVELARAKASAGNTYLLGAKIAQDEGRLEDAHRLIWLASCAPSPCGDRAEEVCPGDACKEDCFERLPCVGNRIAEKKSLEECHNDYAAQVHLAKARLAAEMYDLDSAKCHFADAIESARHVCNYDLRAEFHDTAALIDLAGGNVVQAAAHLDREATLLRLAENYRRIPEVLTLAAAAHNETLRFDLSTDRLCRAARIWLTRGELEKAWEILQQALETGEAEHSPSTRIRLQITAAEIEAAAKEASD